MTAPEKLPADIEALLASERAAPGMPETARSRVLARLGASLPLSPEGGSSSGDGCPGEGAGGPGDGGAAVPADGGAQASLQEAAQASLGASSAATGGASGLFGALAQKPVLLATTMFALGGAGGAVVYHAARGPAPAETQPVSSAATGETRAAEVLPPPPADHGAALFDAGSAIDAATKVSPQEISETAPPPRPAAPPPPDEQLAAERALVEVARTALARGDPKAALEPLRRHASEFPRGQLREEREALWIRALVIDRDFSGAALRAEKFQERYPRSLFLPMIRDALAKSRNQR